MRSESPKIAQGLWLSIPIFMNGKYRGEGSSTFPLFFLSLLFLSLTLAYGFFPSGAKAQKAERDELSRFDRLAEEATLLNKRGQYDQVIFLLEPHKKDKKNDSALFFNELGVAYRNKGKLSEAIQAYKDALSRDPENPAVMKNLGDAFYLRKEHTQAVEQYQKALRSNPRFLQAHFSLGLAYYRLGNYQEALEEFETVLKLDPKDEDARKYRGTIRKKLQEQKKGK